MEKQKQFNPEERYVEIRMSVLRPTDIFIKDAVENEEFSKHKKELELLVNGEWATFDKTETYPSYFLRAQDNEILLMDLDAGTTKYDNPEMWEPKKKHPLIAI